jgi:LuxR family transcriptional regulator, maltose regulon positive regulatory protein
MLATISRGCRSLRGWRVGTGAAVTDAPLLTSKLVVPAVPPDMIDRSRLHRRLDDAARKVLTLVEAPAGWGKTVLLSSWAARAPREGRIAWVAADSDDDSGQFWRYLDAGLRPAIEESHGHGGRAVPVSYTHEGAPDRHRWAVDEGFLARLADALARLPEPVTLVVDNLDQAADQGVWEGLDYLLRHASERLRLIVATREAPSMALHRWRLRGELTEVGTAELAFTPEETEEVVRRHGLALPAANLRDLQRRTEGWPAGVLLAALRIKEMPPSARRVGLPTGEDPQIGDYLLTEVLAGMPDEVRETLVSASVLDRISGGLLRAVTGRGDGDRLLMDLERRGAFLAALDTPPLWYRLNPLLGEALRAELRRTHPSRVSGLHARAARWFADQELAPHALRHALASGDRQLAMDVLVEHWPRLLPCGHREPSTAAAPPGSEARADPEIALAYAASRLAVQDGDGAEPFLRLASRRGDLVPAGRREGFALMTAAFRLAQAQLRGDVPAMTAAAGEILTQIRGGRAEGTDAPHEAAAAIALTALGTAGLINGDLVAAEAALRKGAENAVAAGLPCPGLASQSLLAFVLALRGELHAAARAASDALQAPSCPAQPEPVHCAPAYLALAVVARHRDQLGEAESNADLAASLWDLTTEPALVPTLAVVQAGLSLERGEWARGHDQLRAARRSGPVSGLTAYLGHLVTATEADLLTAHGDAGAARDLVGPLLGADSSVPELNVAYARACLRDRDPRAAVDALQSWMDDRESDRQLPVRIAAGLIDAEATRQVGDGRRASAALERVLRLAEPEDFRRMFTGASAPSRELLLGHLDSGTAHWSFLTELLGAQHTRHPATPATATLAEPLTDRELTVLRYLQSLLSNVEIASELCLSVNTVKTHVRNIYRKLSTTQRRDAVRRARELQLL